MQCGGRGVSCRGQEQSMQCGGRGASCRGQEQSMQFGGRGVSRRGGGEGGGFPGACVGGRRGRRCWSLVCGRYVYGRPACGRSFTAGARDAPPPPHPTPPPHARRSSPAGGAHTPRARAHTHTMRRTHTRHARTRAQVPCAAGRKERRTILDLQAFPYLQHAARRYRVRLDVFKRETPTEFAPEQLARPPPEPARAADDVDEAFEAVRFGRARRPEAARFGRARRPEAARFGGLIPGTAPCVCVARPARVGWPGPQPAPRVADSATYNDPCDPL